MFNARIDNKSSSDLNSISVYLQQNTTLHATSKSRTWSRNVAMVEFKSVKANSCEDWNNGYVIIPPVVASSNNTCRIITVTYYLMLFANPSGVSLSFNAAVPVVIGTIPLKTGDQGAQSMPPSYQLSTMEGGASQGLETEMKGEMTNMDNNFAPSYPYFKDYSV